MFHYNIYYCLVQYHATLCSRVAADFSLRWFAVPTEHYDWSGGS